MDGGASLSSPSLTATEVFKRDFPYYLSIGMTYEQYWYDDPTLIHDYRKAEELKQERLDMAAWLFGTYTGKALDAVVGNALRAFGGKKGNQAKYPDEPVLMEKRKEEEKPNLDEDQELMFAKIYMNNMVQAGKNWGKGK